jgi:hypothetical protein
MTFLPLTELLSHFFKITILLNNSWGRIALSELRKKLKK